MATYDLKYPGAAIDAILDTAYDLQNAGYIFRGLASEYTNTPTERSWVLAGEGETGHGFTSPVPKGYIGVCVFNGTSWTGKLLKCVSIDSTPTNGSTNAISSGGAYASISNLATFIDEALENLTFTDTTPSAFQDEYINMKVSTTEGGVEHILTYLTILAATTEKAGLMTAEDKAKVDSFLTNLRSLTFADTTASADQGTQITETLKATIGGVQEVIDSITILAATSSKAGLLSASDKAYIDALPSALTSLSNSISAARALMESLVGYYTCDTAAGTAAKTVAATGYSLTNGGCIRIKMTNANTAANVTLNINSTGAKALYYDGAQASSTNTWEAGEVLEVYSDGTQYQCASKKDIEIPKNLVVNASLTQNSSTILNLSIQAGETFTVDLEAAGKIDLYYFTGPDGTGTSAKLINQQTGSEFTLTAPVDIKSLRFWSYNVTTNATITILRSIGIVDEILNIENDIEDLQDLCSIANNLVKDGLLSANSATLIDISIQGGETITINLNSAAKIDLYCFTGQGGSGTSVKLIDQKSETSYNLTAPNNIESLRFWCYTGNANVVITVLRSIPIDEYVEDLSERVEEIEKLTSDSVEKTKTETITIPATSNGYCDFMIYEGQKIIVESLTALSGYGIGIYSCNKSVGVLSVETFANTNIVTSKTFVANIPAECLRIYNYMSSSVTVKITYQEKSMGTVSKVNAMPYNLSIVDFVNIDESTFTAVSGDSIIGFINNIDYDYMVDLCELSLIGVAEGDVIPAYVGIIDQRGNLVIRDEYSFTVKNIDEYVSTLEPNEYLEIKQRECIFIVTNGWYSCQLQSPSRYGSLFSYDTTTHHVTAIGNNIVPSHYVISGKILLQNDFASKGELESIQKQVDANTNNIAHALIVKDTVTGETYQIKVTNGQLIASLVNYQKVLFIGNSFTLHPTLANVWWGDGRGMAASVDGAQYPRQIMAGLGGNPTYDRVGGYFFEMDYSPDYDFATLGNYQPYIDFGCLVLGETDTDYDLVVVQLGENSSFSNTMQASWEALYDYLINRFQNADIIQMIGWYNENKYGAISAACTAKGVSLVNCQSDTNTGPFSAGDYVTGSDGSYHALPSAPTSHPSDVGFNKIAHSILYALGVDTDSVDSLLHDITLIQNEGGTISTPYSQWVEGGVLNIRVNAASGYHLGSLLVTAGSETVTAVMRDSTHWTIVMPSSDITITPTWERT